MAGRTVSYTYTPTGQRYQVTDSSRGATPVTYGYDNLNRTISITQPGGNTVSYSYDALGNHTAVNTTVGSVSSATQYSYSPVNQLLSVTAPTDPTGQHTTYTYDLAGRRQQQNLPNGVMVQFGYDNLNRLLTINQSKNAVPIASYTYTLDKAGNRTGVSEGSGRTVSWSYDNAYRLTGEMDSLSPGFTTSYGYDGVGNRLTLSVSNGTTSTVTSSTYNELDQLTGVVGPGQSLSYSYVRGNLVQVKNSATNAIQQSYTWDSADRLVGATVASGSATYAYDADNRRVKQTASGVVTNYLWDETSAYGDVLVETNNSNVIQTSYILGNGDLISQRRNSATTPEYYLKDGQGSVRNLTDSTGSMVSGQNYTYDAFGNLKSGQTSPASSYLYSGQQFDVLTGLYDLRARYYQPSNGGLLSRDPADININDPVELNRYAYVANNPINLSDPSGYNGYAQALIPASSFAFTGSSLALLGVATLGLVVTVVAVATLLPKAKELYNETSEAIKEKGLDKIPFWRNYTIVIAIPTNKQGQSMFLITVSNYFSSNLGPVYEVIRSTLQSAGTLVDKTGILQYGLADHAEKLMVDYLRNTKKVWRAPQIIPGAVSNINGICPSCAASAFNKSNNSADYSIDNTPGSEITLRLATTGFSLGNPDPKRKF